MAKGEPLKGEKIVILDRGHLELAYPTDWECRPDPAGHMVLRDAADACRLEVSYLPVPAGVPREELPPLAEQLRALPHPAGEPSPSVQTEDRGDLWLAWSERAFRCDDEGAGIPERPARTRTLLASNGRFQAVVSFHYWEDDAGWALPAFERILATLRLGDGTQLARPEDHWSQRPRPRRGGGDFG